MQNKPKKRFPVIVYCDTLQEREEIRKKAKASKLTASTYLRKLAEASK